MGGFIPYSKKHATTVSLPPCRRNLTNSTSPSGLFQVGWSSNNCVKFVSFGLVCHIWNPGSLPNCINRIISKIVSVKIDRVAYDMKTMHMFGTRELYSVTVVLYTYFKSNI